MKVRKIGMFTQLFLWLAILLLLGNGLLGIFIYNRSESALFTQIQSNAKNIAQCAAANVSGNILKRIDIVKCLKLLTTNDLKQIEEELELKNYITPEKFEKFLLNYNFT